MTDKPVPTQVVVPRNKPGPTRQMPEHDESKLIAEMTDVDSQPAIEDLEIEIEVLDSDLTATNDASSVPSATCAADASAELSNRQRSREA